MPRMEEGDGDAEFTDDPAPNTDSLGTESAAARTVPEGCSVVTESGWTVMQIRYKLRRDGVQDGCDRIPLFPELEPKNVERDVLWGFERRFNEIVALTGFQKVLVLVNRGHLDEGKNKLAKWGYGGCSSEWPISGF